MSALYMMQYVGVAGGGAGAIYIGKGKILGMDIAGGRYAGSYTEQGGRLKGNATLSMPQGGQLVTGQQVPPGTKIPLTTDWPADFANGRPQTVMVAGRSVQVAFEKIGDIP